MIDIKVCLLVLLLISLVASKEKHFGQRALALRLLHDLKNDELQESDHVRRNHQHEIDENTDTIDSDRRVHDSDIEEEYLELRTTGLKQNNTGPVITLQNRALMNTRLRVLYTDENCTPFLAETGLLLTLQTKSVTLPAQAQNIKIIVQKDMFGENWRVAYTGTLTNGVSKCIRITGVTVSSPIKACK